MNLAPYSYKSTLSFLLNTLNTPMGSLITSQLEMFVLWYSCYAFHGGKVDLNDDQQKILSQLSTNDLLFDPEKESHDNSSYQQIENNKKKRDLLNSMGLPTEVTRGKNFKLEEACYIFTLIQTTKSTRFFETQIEELKQQSTLRSTLLNDQTTSEEWFYSDYVIKAENDDLFVMTQALILNIGIDLSRSQLAVTELAFALSHEPMLSHFVQKTIPENSLNPNTIIEKSLNLSENYLTEFFKATGEDEPLFFERTQTTNMRPLTKFWSTVFVSLYRSTSDFFARFLTPLSKEYNAYSMGQISEEDHQYIAKIFGNKENWRESSNSNILLYGGHSVDKRSVAIDIANRHGFTPFTLHEEIPEDSRLDACFLAQNALASIQDQNHCPLLILTEADKILTKTQRGLMRLMFFTVEVEQATEDTGIEAVILEENPIPSIWIVSNPTNLSENNLGRFIFSCEVSPISREKRKFEIARAFDSLEVSDAFIQEMSTNSQLGEYQLKSAVAFTEKQLMDNDGDREEKIKMTETLLGLAIKRSQKLLGRDKKEDLRLSPTKYDLKFLNLNSAYPVATIVEALKKKKRGSMCFYGVPGTGKTMLGEHIAVALDLPLKIVRASDILDKYIGEAEKNIRRMFDSAAEEGCVLLLDEADSFLRDRTMARHSWEISTVNELLQGMERFPGIFICTTNLFHNLDQACLRRFSFKIEFNALNSQQCWDMFVNEVNPNFKNNEDRNEIMESLAEIKNLTPGDFATVKRQVELMDIQMTPYQWVVSLRTEADAKKKEIATVLDVDNM